MVSQKQNRLQTIANIVLLVLLVVCFYGWVFANKDNKPAHDAVKTVSHGESETYHWRMVTTWPKNFPGLGTGPENFAKLINQLSEGRLTVEVFGAGEIVPALQTFDAVSAGTVEMGHGASYYWKGKIPAEV